MAKTIVAMAAIPGRVPRGKAVRSGIGYARYGQATWRWWCKNNGVEFVLLDRPFGSSGCQALPPTIQRWGAAANLVREFGKGTRVALVDADTMIRWNAPSIFEVAGEHFAAACGGHPNWIDRSIRGFQELFPGVDLPWREYFNSGVVVFGERQLHLMDGLLEIAIARWQDVNRIINSCDVGTDQPLLNFIVRREKEPVHFLPTAFNLLNCVTMTDELREIQADPGPDWQDAAALAFEAPECFDFVDCGYIWHFTNVILLREIAMKETWKRISELYPDALG
jgi:hypothetical protein